MARFTLQPAPRHTPKIVAILMVAAVMIGVAEFGFDAGFAPPFGRGCGFVTVSVVGVAAFAAPKPQRPQNQKSSSPGRGGGRKKKVGGNQNWYNKRKAGVKVASRGPKPPKWEKEGDNLYVNFHTKNDAEETDDEDETSKPKRIAAKKDLSYEDAREILRPFEGETPPPPSTPKSKPKSKPKAPDSDDSSLNKSKSDQEPVKAAQPEMPYMWGGLSVGPVWKSRLVNAGYPQPTPIQVASYTTLLNKKNQTNINGNAVIAATTGSGKSLAYLLPFLTSIDTNNSKKKQKKQHQSTAAAAAVATASAVTPALGRIWIMTPTMELAYQLQRTVDKVIVGETLEKDNDGGDKTSNVLHVVEYNRGAVPPRGSSKREYSFSTSYPILADIVHRTYNNDDSTISQEPTFLAGTPKLFLQLRKEIKQVLASTTRVDSNLRYAKQRHARELREAREGISDENGEDKDDQNDDDVDDTEDQMLYRKVALALKGNLETLILDEVDRLLQTTTAMTRREHQTTKPLAQELLEALVWESKSKKPTAHGTGRRGRPSSNSFAPSSLASKLQIVCASATIGRSLRRQLMYIVQAPSMDKAAVLITADVRTKKNADLRKASLLPSNLKHSYRILSRSETKEAAATKRLEALVTILRAQELSPHAPSLVFPGAVGVETVRDYLVESGFRDIRGLSSLRKTRDTSSSTSIDDNNNGDGDGDDDSRALSPMDTPVYVVKERLARGLDLPDVRKVVLLQTPTNAAAYAHLAGRTARQNTPGDCVTICRPSEAYELASIAETLGLSRWRCLEPEHGEQQQQP